MKQLANLQKEYDISGPGGNAWAVMGCMKNWARQLAKAGVFDASEIQPMMDEAMSGDYRHLLETFETALGVTFVNPQDDEDEYWC